MGARVSQQICKSTFPLSDFPSDYWEHIATYLEEGLVIIDHQQNIVFFNAAAESLTSCSQTQVRGSPYDLVFAANPWIIDLVLRARASGYNRTAGEGELRDRLEQYGHIKRQHMTRITSAHDERQHMMSGST